MDANFKRRYELVFDQDEVETCPDPDPLQNQNPNLNSALGLPPAAFAFRSFSSSGVEQTGGEVGPAAISGLTAAPSVAPLCSHARRLAPSRSSSVLPKISTRQVQPQQQEPLHVISSGEEGKCLFSENGGREGAALSVEDDAPSSSRGTKGGCCADGALGGRWRREAAKTLKNDGQRGSCEPLDSSQQSLLGMETQMAKEESCAAEDLCSSARCQAAVEQKLRGLSGKWLLRATQGHTIPYIRR